MADNKTTVYRGKIIDLYLERVTLPNGAVAELEIVRHPGGAAVVALDNDGDLDILATNNGGEPQLFRNDGGNKRHWIELRLIGARSNRDGVGARVKVVAGSLTQVDERKGGMSYQSAQDPRLHFGLGDAARVDSIEVRWPSGAVDRLSNIPADRELTIKEGGSAR